MRPARAEFDLVRGLTGLGAYLLGRDPDGRQLRQILAYLVRLTDPIPATDAAGTSVPGWWTLDIPHGRPPTVYRGGHADLGMAHGITGPLALLALTARAGITVDGQAAAIERICRWLVGWQQTGPTGAWWPERITLADHEAQAALWQRPARPSWCYGTPGIARALQLAGQALGDHRRARAADRALLGWNDRRAPP